MQFEMQSRQGEEFVGSDRPIPVENADHLAAEAPDRSHSKRVSHAPRRIEPPERVPKKGGSRRVPREYLVPSNRMLYRGRGTELLAQAGSSQLHFASKNANQAPGFRVPRDCF